MDIYTTGVQWTIICLCVGYFLGQYYTNKDWHKDLAYKSKYKGSLYANGKFYKVEEENPNL